MGVDPCCKPPSRQEPCLPCPAGHLEVSGVGGVAADQHHSGHLHAARGAQPDVGWRSSQGRTAPGARLDTTVSVQGLRGGGLPPFQDRRGAAGGPTWPFSTSSMARFTKRHWTCGARAVRPAQLVSQCNHPPAAEQVPWTAAARGPRVHNGWLPALEARLGAVVGVQQHKVALPAVAQLEPVVLGAQTGKRGARVTAAPRPRGTTCRRRRCRRATSACLPAYWEQAAGAQAGQRLTCLSYSFSAGMLGASLELVQGSSRPAM